MHFRKDELTRLKPIKFPRDKGAGHFVPIKSTKGKTTKEVITEMKRISKKDIFAPDSNDRK